MGFDRRFTLGLVFRIAVLLLALILVVWAFRTPALVMVRVVTLAIAALAAVGLWRHVDRTNAEIARFLEAVRLGDVAAHFPTRGSAGFGQLGEALNDAIRRLRTERGATDAELRYYEALIDDMPIALLTVEDGRVEPGNKAARRMFARHAGVRPADFATYGATFAARLSDPGDPAQEGHEEMLILNLDGRAKRTLVRRATLNRLGRRINAIVVQPVQDRLDAVEMAAQTDIVRVLTHEILNSLTPVTSLAVTAAGLLGEVRGDERVDDARHAVATLARRAEGLGAFVASYREVAREPTVVRERFDADVFVADHARLFVAEWPDVALDTSVAPGAMLDADRALVSQLVMNLMRNAAQAASAHRTDPAIALRISIAAGRDVAIEVSDNGPGVPPDLRNDIFLPFFTTRAAGTGIGLNLARQIVIAHGGAIEIEDADAGGARFRVVI